MSKYGRGLGKELFLAVIEGRMSQPFSVEDCRKYAKSRGWDVPENYLRVALANSEVKRGHSPTYKDYFVRVSEGKYIINPHISE